MLLSHSGELRALARKYKPVFHTWWLGRKYTSSDALPLPYSLTKFCCDQLQKFAARRAFMELPVES